MGTSKFEMTVDMSVLESLGINLYSNAAAVLSELVANAWDADATQVSIKWQHGDHAVVVTDNGRGMTAGELNQRFLKVGYKKRKEEGGSSPVFNRKFMGRKGIGKLSVFSIAKTVCVYSTTASGESEGLRIDVDELTDAISQGAPYHPAEIAVPVEFASPGVTIHMTELKSKRADLTASALRKRLARRFDVLDPTPPEKGGFAILVNDHKVNFADRQELKKLEFLWEFGQKTLDAKVLPTSLAGRFVFSTDTIAGGQGWQVKGWIGTAKKPTDLTEDEDAGSLKNIIVLARKRPIQEGIIEKLDFSRLFGNYVTGQIEADFLDVDGEDDIATSDRQRLIEDDPRVVALQAFLRDRFLEASQQWADARPKAEIKDALDRYPKLREWIEDQPQWRQEPAEKMIGTIAGLELEGKESETDRKELFRSGILAFERVGLREAITDLEQLSTLTAVDLLPVLARQSDYESALWVDILRGRVNAISQFQELSSADEKETVLQKHLFHNLWLLDASWERAALSEKMEENLRKVAPPLFAMNASQKEITGRMDIRYATIAGTHVIVELKRYSVPTDIDDLYNQGAKYATALDDLLTKQGKPGSRIEVVFVLGKPPSAKNKGPGPADAFIQGRLAPINGKIVYYDELIANAESQYSDYLAASKKAQDLDALIGQIT